MVEHADRLELTMQRAGRAHDEALADAQRLQRQVDNLNDELHRERQRSAEAATAQERIASDRSAQSSDFQKALIDNDGLRAELRSTQQELQSSRSTANELRNILREAELDHQDLERALASAIARATDVGAELDATKADAQAMSGELHEARVRAASVEAQASEELQSAAEHIASLERAISELKRQVADTQAPSRVAALLDAAALSSSRAHAGEVTAARDELAVLLDQTNDQLRACMAQLRQAKVDTIAAVDDAVRDARLRCTQLEREQEQARSELARTSQALQRAQGQVAKLEESLGFLTHRQAQYEAGHGIAGAAAEARQLQLALAERDSEIARLSANAGEQWDRYDSLLEVARRLAIEAGAGEDVDVFGLYPLPGVRASVASTWEGLRAANSELARQNEELEAQRGKLLRQLRVHASNAGEEALVHYGLSAEHMAAVNEFAEALRSGRADLPLTDRSATLQAELRQAQATIRGLRSELAEASLSVEDRVSAAAAAASRASLASAARVDTEASAAGLREALRGLREENAGLHEVVRRLRRAVAPSSRAFPDALPVPLLTLGSDAQLSDVVELLHTAEAQRRALHPDAAPLLLGALHRLADNARDLAEWGAAQAQAATELVAAGGGGGAAVASARLAAVQAEMSLLQQLLEEQGARNAALQRQLREQVDRSATHVEAAPAKSCGGEDTGVTQALLPPPELSALRGAAAASERELARALLAKKEAEEASAAAAAELASTHTQLTDLQVLLAQYEGRPVGGGRDAPCAPAAALATRISQLHVSLRAAQATVRQQRGGLARLCGEYGIPREAVAGLDVAEEPAPAAGGEASLSAAAHAAAVAVQSASTISALRRSLRRMRAQDRASRLRVSASKRGLAVRTAQLTALLEALRQNGVDARALLKSEADIEAALGDSSSDDDTDELDVDGSDASESDHAGSGGAFCDGGSDGSGDGDEEPGPAAGDPDDRGAEKQHSATLVAVQRLRSAYEAETRRLQESAAATIRSLRQVVADRDSDLDAIRSHMSARVQDLEAQLSASGSERARLLGEAEDRLQAAVAQVKAAYADGAAGGALAVGASTSAAAAELQRRVGELEAALDARDRRLQEADAALQGAQRATAAAQERAVLSAGESDDLRVSMVLLQGSVHEKQGEAARAAARLEAAQAAARAEIEARDRKLAALSAALQTLRSEVVAAEGEHVQALAELAAETARLQRLREPQPLSEDLHPPPVAPVPPSQPARRDSTARASLEADRMGLAAEVVRLTSALSAQKAAYERAVSTSSRLRLEVGTLRQRLQVARAAGTSTEPSEPQPHPRPHSANDASHSSALPSQLAASLDTQRALRRRVEALTARVTMLQRERTEAGAREATAAGRAERLRAERDALGRRLTAQHKRQDALEAAVQDALSQLLPAETAAAHAMDLSRGLADARTAAAELEQHVSVLKAQLQEQRCRADAAALTVKALQSQASATGQTAGGSDKTSDFKPNLLPAHEHVQLTDARSRAEAALGQVASLSLQAQALTSVSEAREARLAQLSALCAVVLRGDTRLLSDTPALEALVTKVRAQPPTAGGAHKSASQPPGSQGTHFDASSVEEQHQQQHDRDLRALRAAKAEAAALRAQLRDVQERPSAAAALRRALQRAHAESASLREKLVVAEQRASSATRNRSGGGQAESDPAPDQDQHSGTAQSGGIVDPEQQISQLRERCNQLEQRLQHAVAAAARSQPSTAATTPEHRPRSKAAQANRTRQGNAEAASVTAADIGSHADHPEADSAFHTERERLFAVETRTLRAEVRRLSAENDALGEELAAFDAEFFEQLEDLKWRYARAAAKGRAFDAYVRAYPPVHGLPPDIERLPAPT